MGTGSSFLAFAIMAAKRGLSTDLRGRKSLYYLGGLTEGTETILFLALACLLPAWFALLALAVRRHVLADHRWAGGMAGYQLLREAAPDTLERSWASAISRRGR